MHLRMLLPTLAVGMLVLSGCSQMPSLPGQQLPPPDKPKAEEPEPIGKTSPLPPAEQPEITRPPTSAKPSEPPPRSPKEVSSSAVMSLIDSADKFAREGEWDRAAALLERALNIEPRNPFLYQRLAAVRLGQKQPQQAEALAGKSNSLARRNPFIRGDNWELIAEARRLSGNASGQKKAMDKAEQYRLQSAAYQ